MIARAAFQLYQRENLTNLRGLGICGIYLVSSAAVLEQLPLFEEVSQRGHRLQTVMDQLKRKYGEGILVPALNLLASEPKGSGKR